MKISRAFPFIGLGLIFAIQAALWFHMPLSGVDGPASWSHAYSLMNGHLFHDYFFNSPPRFLTGILATPYFILFKSEYAPFGFFLIWQALTLGMILSLSNKFHWSSMKMWSMAFLLVATPLFWTQRQELLALPLILFFYSLAFKDEENEQDWKTLAIMGLVFLLCLGIHPIAGFLCILLFFLRHKRDKRKIQFLAYLIVSIAILATTLFKPHFAYYMNHLEVRLRNFDYLKPLSGFLFTFPMIALAVWSPKTRGFVFPILVVLSILMMSYYWLYAFVFLLFVPNDKFKSFIAIPGTLFLLVFSLVNPLFQHIENPQYGPRVKAILSEDKLNQPGSKTFIESSISIPVIYEEHSRLVVIKGNDVIFHDDFETGDIAYLTRNPENLVFPINKTIHSERLIEPCKGLLTLKSGYAHRSDSIGLWKVYLP